MKSQEIKKFLNFVQTLIPTEPLAIYYSRENNGNDYYYFYTGLNCEVKVTSIGDNINFAFKSGIQGKSHKDTNDTSVNVSFEEAKPILDQLFQAWQLRKLDDFLIHNKMTIDDIKKDLDFINEYLKVTDLTKRFENQQENLNLYLKSETQEYEVNVGRLYNETPQKKNILHICEIPVVLKARGPKGHVYIEHVVLGWDIALYEGLKPVIKVDNGADSLQDFSDKLKKVNPELGTFFLASKLAEELPEKCSTVKPLKL
jgi:hypothetical protein